MTSFKAILVLLASMYVAVGTVMAAGQPGQGLDNAAAAANPPPNVVEREVIPGADNMTSAERDAYRRRMAGATTPEEKAKVRAEYAKGESALASVNAPALSGDPVRGAQLQRGCFGCHGMERWVAPVTYAAAGFIDSVLRASGLSDLPPAAPTRFKGRIGSLSALRDGVNRRNDYLNPKMTPQEVEDIVAYLNVTYYKFQQ